MSASKILDEDNFQFNLEIEAISNKNKQYLIIFNAKTYSYLEITAINKTDIIKKTFSNKFTPEQIKENKYMNIFDDLQEICNELKERVNQNSLKIKEENNSIFISITLPNSKIKEVIFELKEIENNAKDNINDLSKIILDLKNENELLKKEIKEIKADYIKEINNLKNITNNQNNDINKLKEQMKIFLNFYDNIKKEEEFLININSSIITNNKKYKKALKNWINPDKNIIAQLLYKKSRDGDKISTFHELCNDKGPTLTLFETDDGNIGGLYTPLSWDNNSTWKHDMESFMFNLNKNKKYKKLKNDRSIYSHESYGPWSYSFGFYVRDQMNKIEHEGKSIDSFYENGSEILLNNTTTSKFFNVLEVEVFKININ
jgi:hypothetical protein